MASQPSTSTPAPGQHRLARLVRAPLAWVRGYKIAAALGGVALATVIGSLAVATLVFRPAPQQDGSSRLGEALAKLDAGDTSAARLVAAEMQADDALTYVDLGGPMFVLGAVTAREAEEHLNPHQQQLLYLVAARYLEESRSRGFPEGRETDGLLLLGRALHHSGRYAQSLPYLREALTQDTHAAGELHRLLADAYLHLSPPNFDDALHHSQRYLTLRGLAPSELDAGRLLAGRILLAKGDLLAAQAAAAQVQENSPQHGEAVILQAEITVRSHKPDAQARDDKPHQPDASARDESLTRTIDALRRLQTRDRLTSDFAAQAQLLIGRCYELQGDATAALAQFDRVRRTHFGSPESLAAAIYQADLERSAGKSHEAVALYQRALSQAGPRDAYRNRWLSLDELESRLRAATEDLIARKQYPAALDLAAALPPLLPEVLSLQQQVAAHEAWGRQLVAQSQSEPLPQTDVTAAEARQQFREAGVAAERLAQARIATRHYLDDLLAAAGSFLRGQNYQAAARVYRQFLRQDPQQGQPEALVGLGESLAALKQLDEARQALARCRETYPAHPATYRARILESLALQEQGQLAEARQLLLDNLYRFALAPQSTDWRDSLFALGNLLYREGLELETRSRLAGVDRADPQSKQEGLKLLEESHATFHEAIRTLTQATDRYPAAIGTAEARYRIAEAYRHSAKWPRKKLGMVSIETNRVTLNRQIQQELHAALEQYNALLGELAAPPTSDSRHPTAAAILRNCYFGRADALFDLGRYEEAIRAYSDATNRYQHEPESLAAYVQIASCYRALKRPGEARGTMEQARVVLERIRKDADFTRTTPLGRQEWTNLLAWLRTL